MLLENKRWPKQTTDVNIFYNYESLKTSIMENSS